MKRTSKRNIGAPAKSRTTAGFTLIEMLISLAILVTVTGAVFEQINAMQKKANSEAVNVDLNQQSRDFLDQTVRDLHAAGYPSFHMYSAGQLAPSTMVAYGLIRVSPTEILLEGDVNNDGNVYSVDISYVANDPNDPNCPCIRRSAQPKIAADSSNQAADSLNQPASPFYTETQHVLSGTGPGQSGEDLFTYFDQNGKAVPIGNGVDISTPEGSTTPSGQTLISSIKTVKINLSLLTNQRDLQSGGFTRTSMSASARLNY
jgi:prepilin-type N-terminal cleavage/methylation domain-containing protein